MNTLVLHPDHPLDFERIHGSLKSKLKLELSAEAIERMDAGRSWLERHISETDRPIYGINTGFGSLCDTGVSEGEIDRLQENLILSHACGLGAEVPAEVVSLMLLFKAQAFVYGLSGVRSELTQRLVDMYNADCLPLVYRFGSLGASGDLAPLAHVSLALIGRGEVRLKGKKMKAADALDSLGWKPLILKSKEGLALLNGTQFMSAHAVSALMRAYRYSYTADLIASLSIDAFDARPEPFDPRLHRIRKQPGQARCAERIREFLEGSPSFWGEKKHVQDPYSFRCIPQVHGASLDVFDRVRELLEAELDSVTDNPTVFPDEAVLSGGNFHGQPIAMACDYLALAIHEYAHIAERRIFQLQSGLRGLKPYLAANPGLNSGLMIAQYAAASLVSRNKSLCSPASADSIPSSNNQEDHVSMGANAATRLSEMLDHWLDIQSIELMHAAQALDLCGRPSSPLLEEFKKAYRERVGFLSEDSEMKPLLDAGSYFIDSIELESFPEP